MYRDSEWGDDESEFERDDESLERWDSRDPEEIPLDEVERYGFGEDGHGYRVLVDEDDDDSERFEGFWEEPDGKVRSPFAQLSSLEPQPSVVVAEVETEDAEADIPDQPVGNGAGTVGEDPGTPPEGDQVQAEERQGVVARFRRWVAGAIGS